MTSLLQRWGQGARFFGGQEMVVSCVKGLQLIWGCWRLISDNKMVGLPHWQPRIHCKSCLTLVLLHHIFLLWVIPFLYIFRRRTRKSLKNTESDWSSSSSPNESSLFLAENLVELRFFNSNVNANTQNEEDGPGTPDHADHGSGGRPWGIPNGCDVWPWYVTALLLQ